MLFSQHTSIYDSRRKSGSGLKKWLSRSRHSSKAENRKSMNDMYKDSSYQLQSNDDSGIAGSPNPPTASSRKPKDAKRFSRCSLPATACLPMSDHEHSATAKENSTEIAMHVALGADTADGSCGGKSRVAKAMHSLRTRPDHARISSCVNARLLKRKGVNSDAISSQTPRIPVPNRQRSLIYAMYLSGSSAEDDTAESAATAQVPMPLQQQQHQQQHGSGQEQEQEQHYDLGYGQELSLARQSLYNRRSLTAADSISATFVSCQSSAMSSLQSGVTSYRSIPALDFSLEQFAYSPSLPQASCRRDSARCSTEAPALDSAECASVSSGVSRYSIAASDAHSEDTTASSDSSSSSPYMEAPSVEEAYLCSERYAPCLSTIERAHDGRLIIKPSSTAPRDTCSAQGSQEHAHDVLSAGANSACIGDSDELSAEYRSDASYIEANKCKGTSVLHGADEGIRSIAVDKFPPVDINYSCPRFRGHKEKKPNDSFVIHASKLGMSNTTATAHSNCNYHQSLLMHTDADYPPSPAYSSGPHGETHETGADVARRSIITPPDSPDKHRSVISASDEEEAVQLQQQPVLHEAKHAPASASDEPLEDMFTRTLQDTAHTPRTEASIQTSTAPSAETAAVYALGWHVDLPSMQTLEAEVMAPSNSCSAAQLDIAGSIFNQQAESRVSDSSLFSTTNITGEADCAGSGLGSTSETSTAGADAVPVPIGAAVTATATATAADSVEDSRCADTLTSCSSSSSSPSSSDAKNDSRLPDSAVKHNERMCAGSNSGRGLYGRLVEGNVYSDSSSRILSTLSDISVSDLPFSSISHVLPFTSSSYIAPGNEDVGFLFSAYSGTEGLDPPPSLVTAAAIANSDEEVITGSGGRSFQPYSPQVLAENISNVSGSLPEVAQHTGFSLSYAQHQSRVDSSGHSSYCNHSGGSSDNPPSLLPLKTRRLSAVLANSTTLSGLRHLHRKIKATSQRPLSTINLSNSSGHGSGSGSGNGNGNGSKGAKPAKAFRFNELVAVYETWDSGDYDRRGSSVVKLDPDLVESIKRELNEFKVYEMSVHEQSRCNTHLIF